MNKSNFLQPSAPANTMYLTINGIPQLYYMLKQDEYMELQNKANTAVMSTPVADEPTTHTFTQSNMREDEEYLDREKVSRILHVDKSTLWRWAKEGKLEYYKVGPRRVLYKTEDVKNLLNNKKN